MDGPLGFFFTTMSMFPTAFVVANAMPATPAAIAPIISAQRSFFIVSILDPDIAWRSATASIAFPGDRN